jgi:prepilin-type N-terminal cleavage/methylation domain-containing protein
MREERGFTLVEILISMAILGILIAAVGGALIVSLRTSDATKARLSQSHDVQIASAYVANDVQSASSVDVPGSTSNCSAAFTTLVTFTYGTTGHPTAVYECGTATNGETQIRRTFNSGTPIVIAHFAGTARPDVLVTYDPAHPTIPVSVTMTFTKGSDCTLDCTYTLFGSRRSFDPSGGVGTGGPPTGDVVLLSVGTSSPLWVQGSCPDPGTTLGCIIDPTKTALPISDVATTDWTPVPLWSPLADADPATAVTSAAGKKTEAKVLLSGVDRPDPGVLPTVEFHAMKVGGSSPRVTLSLYDGGTLLTSQSGIGPINQSRSYDWTLTPAQTAAIPQAAYAHLTVGFAVSNASGTDSVAVDGVAFDSFDLTSAGLLTIKGPLYVNINPALTTTGVRLTGVKTANKITISNGGDFQMLNPGVCAGCNHNTVDCAACTWVGQQPWTNYAQPIPDPLRALPAPDPATLGTGSCNGSGACSPGVYATTFSRTSNTTISPGIYYFEAGMSISGTASVSCPAPCTGGVMLYIAGGAVSFTGQSQISVPAPSSGIYKGIVMFQARSDTNALKFAGNSGSSTFCTMGGVQYGNCLDGIVYVPNATQVTLATGSASLAAHSIVAQNIKVSSSVTIG